MRTEAVNPDMELSKSPATSEATLQEKESAKMPDEGTFPTGKKAANKVTPGMG